MCARFACLPFYLDELVGILPFIIVSTVCMFACVSDHLALWSTFRLSMKYLRVSQSHISDYKHMRLQMEPPTSCLMEVLSETS